jgi:hypothetical protein
MVELCLHSPIRLHGVVLNYLSTGRTVTLSHDFYIANLSSDIKKRDILQLAADNDRYYILGPDVV